jgi:hypothetical protein
VTRQKETNSLLFLWQNTSFILNIHLLFWYCCLCCCAGTIDPSTRDVCALLLVVQIIHSCTINSRFRHSRCTLHFQITHYHTHTHTLSHYHTITHYHTQSHTITLSHYHTITHYRIHTHTITHTQSHTISLSQIFDICIWFNRLVSTFWIVSWLIFFCDVCFQVNSETTAVEAKDFRLYCYYGGMLYIGLKKFQRALEFFKNVCWFDSLIFFFLISQFVHF